MERSGVSRDTIRAFLSPVEGGGYGIGPDVLSAYCAYAAGLQHPGDGDDQRGDQMFPGGNTGLARLMVKTLVPDAISGPRSAEGVSRGLVDFRALDRAGQPTRIRLRSTVVVRGPRRARRSGSPMPTWSRWRTCAGGRVHRIRARAVVMAGGGWTDQARRPRSDVCPPARRMPASTARPASWRTSPSGTGASSTSSASPAAAGSRVWATTWRCGGRRPSAAPGASFVARFTDGAHGEGPLLLPRRDHRRAGGPGANRDAGTTSFRAVRASPARAARAPCSGARASTPAGTSRASCSIAGDTPTSTPQPGFFFGRNGKPAPRDVLRGALHGRIAFANTELAGAMDHRNCFSESERAIRQIDAQVFGA